MPLQRYPSRLKITTYLGKKCCVWLQIVLLLMQLSLLSNTAVVNRSSQMPPSIRHTLGHFVHPAQALAAQPIFRHSFFDLPDQIALFLRSKTFFGQTYTLINFSAPRDTREIRLLVFADLMQLNVYGTLGLSEY